MPILARHHVPALFFVATRHVGNDGVLWFTYLSALERCYSRPDSLFAVNTTTWPPAETILSRNCAERLAGLRAYPAAMYAASRTNCRRARVVCVERDFEDWFAG